MLPATARFDYEFLTSCKARLMVDSWCLFRAWAAEYGERAYLNLRIIGTHWHGLLDSEKLLAVRVEEIADAATGAIPAHRNDAGMLSCAPPEVCRLKELSGQPASYAAPPLSNRLVLCSSCGKVKQCRN